jgi:hypothetical protein
VGISRTGEALVELEQGNSIAHGSYTVRIRRDAGPADSSSSTVRFWLDPRYSHDVADANGFFHLEARCEKTLLTYLVIPFGPACTPVRGENSPNRPVEPVLVKNYGIAPSAGSSGRVRPPFCGHGKR